MRLAVSTGWANASAGRPGTGFVAAASPASTATAAHTLTSATTATSSSKYTHDFTSIYWLIKGNHEDCPYGRPRGSPLPPRRRRRRPPRPLPEPRADMVRRVSAGRPVCLPDGATSCAGSRFSTHSSPNRSRLERRANPLSASSTTRERSRVAGTPLTGYGLTSITGGLAGVSASRSRDCGCSSSRFSNAVPTILSSFLWYPLFAQSINFLQERGDRLA